jgi:integrase
LAGEWKKSRTPSIYVQTDKRTSKPRYKAVFRDSRQKVTSKTFSRLREAQTFLAELHTRRSRGELPDTSKGRKTVQELYDHFKATSRARESTLALYEQHYRKWVAPALASRRIDSIKRSEVEAFYSDVERKASLPIRRAAQQLLHKLFAVAVQSEWLTRNPAHGIGMPNVKRREPRFLSEAELDRIVGEVEPRYRALVWTLAISGLRIGEASALRVKNLDGSIRVRENSPEVGGRKYIGPTKTDGSERVVPIPLSLRTMLRDHLKIYGNLFDPEAFVFTTEKGMQIRQNNFRKRVWQPAVKKAGIDPIPTVHDLRHTAASLMLKRGLTTFEVAKTLGHSTTVMVEKLYGHLYEAPLQAKIDLLDDVFSS